jgi:hypothetical protein
MFAGPVGINRRLRSLSITISCQVYFIQRICLLKLHPVAAVTTSNAPKKRSVKTANDWAIRTENPGLMLSGIIRRVIGTIAPAALG